jgi:type I restriction enzyme R subunit
LRTPEGKPYFDSVIIVTDRNVLDAQLQEAVQQIDHQFGVIDAIDRKNSNKSKSTQLADALIAATPIIVVTIQTFPYAMQAILTEKSLNDKKFAVIIDEAHNSQTGSTAQGLRAALTLESKDKMEDMTVEELLAQVQQSRVRPNNVSYFAFTATPKHSTLTLFGRVNDEGLPQSFHRYTMRQAIDEGFILDVLENYTPYKTALHLSTQIEDDKRVDKKQARKSLAKWLSLHPTNVTQKVEFIIEHFRANVSQLLNGEAKAMVVTSSRAAAVKYKLAFDKFIDRHGYEDVRALVAFSGKITGDDLTKDTETNVAGNPFIVDVATEFTERSMNPGIGSQDLRNAFDTDEYRVMLVANKFQTGFNQPKLVAMYLDKKISGIEAVQTMSRLNRTYPGKDKTFVIDFVNEPETIRQAFAQYDDGAQIVETQDLDVVYDMKSQLDTENIYNHHDLEMFKLACVKSLKAGELNPTAHKNLYAATQRATDVFNAKLKSLKTIIDQWEASFQKAHKLGDEKGKKTAEHNRSQYTKEREDLMLFKSRLGRFCRVYGYIAQLIDFADPDLENFATFAKLLAKRLDGVTPDQVDLSGLVLSRISIDAINEPQGGDGGDETDDGKVAPVKPITADESEGSDREREFLNEIIERINQIFGDLAPEDDQKSFTAQVATTASKNAVIVDQIEQNPKHQVMQGDLPKEVAQAVIQAMGANDAMARVLLADKQCMNDFVGVIYDLVKSKEPNKVLAIG